MGRIGSRIANVVMFVLSCSLVGNVINEVGGAMLTPEFSSAPPIAASQAPAAHDWNDRKVILDRNLFGAQVVSEAVMVEQVPVEEDLQETRLPLKLLGTIASADQAVANAAIENTSSRQHEVVMVGDFLTSHTEVEVARIDRGRVVLQNGPRREELKLAEDLAPGGAAITPTRDGSSRRHSRRSAQTGNSVRDRLEELAGQQGDRSPAAIFSGARILPKYESGEMVGIELSKIKPDSIYEKAGLQDGDVLMELNGIKIDNPSASKQLLEAFTNADTIELNVMGEDGSTRTVSVASDLLSQ